MRNFNRLIVVFMALGLLFAVLSGCAEMEGEMDANKPPVVDFVNVHDSSSTIVYDYAPEIMWKGSDPDGFVDHYSYADITDAAAIDNPEGYVDLIPDEVWKDTIATSARIFLLSEEGAVTEHIFYVRCTDNEGMKSSVSFRPFFRSNRPPNVPKIGLTGEDEENYAERRTITTDTLFSAPEITSTYPGLSFSWRGSDPDDKTLFKIPLEYQAILVKSPSDTIFVRNWSDDTDIVLADLETGNYTLNVWSRDDGYTLSVNPARIEFYVIRPTFEHNLLVVMEATNPINTQNPENSIHNTPNPADINVFYDQLLRDVAPQLSNVNLNFDDVDVKKILLTDFITNGRLNVPSRAQFAQYKMVLFIQDQFRTSSGNNDYTNMKVELLDDYLAVGGRVWVVGRMVGGSSFNYTNSADSRDLLLRYFGVNDIVGRNSWIGTGSNCYAEFIGTRRGVSEFPELAFDDTKVSEHWLPNADYLPDNYGESGVERIERSEGAETTQYFYSYTATGLIDVVAEDATIPQTVTINGVAINYPPTQTACYLQTDNDHIETVESVVNVTKQEAGASNAVGEVVFVNNNIIFVSYDEGQPWSDADSVAVNYTYDPISDFHLKPCAVRYEGVDNNDVFSELRFRTALTAYSPYFMERAGVLEEWVLMLDWFFNPELNSANIIITKQ